MQLSPTVASAAVCSRAAVLLLLIHCLFFSHTVCVFVCVWSLSCSAVLGALSSFAIISLFCDCLLFVMVVSVLWLSSSLCPGLIMVFPGHTHLRFYIHLLE